MSNNGIIANPTLIPIQSDNPVFVTKTIATEKKKYIPVNTISFTILNSFIIPLVSYIKKAN
jgi:hypothetical protein